MKKKRWMGIAFAVVLGIFLTGCGKKQNEQQSKQERVKDYVYQLTEIEMPEKDAEVSQLIRIHDKTYAYTYQWFEPETVQPRTEEVEESAESEDEIADGAPVETETASFCISLCEIREDGTVGECYQIMGSDGDNFYSFCGDEDNYLYCIHNRFFYGESDEENYDDYYLEQRTLDGEVTWSVKLNELPELQKMEEENGYFNASDLFINGNTLYLNGPGKYVKFDAQGNYLGKVMQDQFDETLQGAQIVKMKDQRYVAISYGESSMQAAEIDLDKGTVGESYPIPGNSYDYFFYTGYQYDLYISDTYGIYGYNLGDEDKVKLLSYVDSDIDTWSITQIVPINETQFFGTYHDSATGTGHVAIFTKQDPKDVKDKEILTLAMANRDDSLKSRVIAFNKSNDQYRIDLRDYSAMYTENGDYSEGISKLNTDIVSGKIPDIILLDSNMPVDSYINKGLFTDLYPFIENDEQIQLEDLMPNILEAFSTDGKLYTLVPMFRIQTLLAKASEVGTERGWTVEEAVNLWDSKPEGTEFMPATTREEMMYNCMYFAGNQFVDYETGKCHFDTDDFVQMLDFINRFPKEISDDYYTDQYWQEYNAMWRDGRALTNQFYFSQLRDLNYMKNGTFGEDITLIGFPSANKDGSSIIPVLQFAISSKSKNQDGAWEFLRYYLMEDYQIGEYGFPIVTKYLEMKAEEATKRPYYLDEHGNKVEYDETVYINDVEVVVDPMSQEEADAYVELLKSFTQVCRYDETLLNIISEEAEPYFSGQKSAKEVAQIIQSRAQVYLNEIS